MKHVAFATYSNEPQMYKGDQLLIHPLLRRRIETTAVTWDDPNADWSVFDAVVLRSTWDYHLRIEEFQGWLGTLEDIGVTVLNPLPLVRWNMNKQYLQQLAERGIRTLPALYLQAGERTALSSVLAEQAWEQAVVKPLVSASGDDTWQTTSAVAAFDQGKLDAMLRKQGAIIQPFAPQIREGEWSLMFFNGIFSHAVLKKPAEGSMFVHVERGGSNHLQEPPHALIAQAGQVIRTAHEITGIQPIYARVDGVVEDGHLVLMELECIEPELFLTEGVPYAAERFADAIAWAMD
ncbi:MAG: hypothetical protein KC496_15560 [Anaerolineae bacterium]|nr:hypothetical protein [Anaerolineae bacterium]